MTVIGIHTPESDHERNVADVERKAKAGGLAYPIVIDNENRIWNEWGNRYWPSTYLVDKSGFVRYRWDGELKWNRTDGESILRSKIEELLAEPGPKLAEPKKPAKPCAS